MAVFTARLTLETRISNWSGDNKGAIELDACWFGTPWWSSG